MTQTRTPSQTRSVETRIEINAPADAVWKALTDPAELTRWFPLEARVTPGPGGSVWMSWGEPWAGEARIEIWEPKRHLRLLEPSPGGPEKPIVTDYSLESRRGQTILRLVQSGFDEEADWVDEYYQSVSRGWPFVLANLRHYLDYHRGTPRVVAWPRMDVNLPRETIWERLLSSDGFLRDGQLSSVAPGHPYAIEAATGDRFQGVMEFFNPPWSFCGTVENQNQSLLWVHSEKLANAYQIWIWLSTYGLGAGAVEAFTHRWQDCLRRLFPDGTIRG